MNSEFIFLCVFHHSVLFLYCVICIWHISYITFFLNIPLCFTTILFCFFELLILLFLFLIWYVLFIKVKSGSRVTRLTAIEEPLTLLESIIECLLFYWAYLRSQALYITLPILYSLTPKNEFNLDDHYSSDCPTHHVFKIDIPMLLSRLLL